MGEKKNRFRKCVMAEAKRKKWDLEGDRKSNNRKKWI